MLIVVNGLFMMSLLNWSGRLPPRYPLTWCSLLIKSVNGKSFYATGRNNRTMIVCFSDMLYRELYKQLTRNRKTHESFQKYIKFHILYTRIQNIHRVGVAQRLCNGLPRNDPGFDSRWGRCKNRASRPLQGTFIGGAIS